MFLPTVVLVPLLLVALLLGAVFSFVFSMMKSSEPYKHAVSLASQDSRIVTQLGAPVTQGWFTTGNISIAGDAGNANRAIPLNGILRHGTVYVLAGKSAGVWRYKLLEVQIDGVPDHVNLLSPPAEDK